MHSKIPTSYETVHWTQHTMSPTKPTCLHIGLLYWEVYKLIFTHFCTNRISPTNDKPTLINTCGFIQIYIFNISNATGTYSYIKRNYDVPGKRKNA